MKKYLIILCFQLLTYHTFSQTIPQEKNGKYCFTFKNTFFEVDPQTGGRISSFKFKGKELLFIDSTGKNNNWGSTFWPAPQSVWGWPPHDTLDSSPYSSIVNNNVLTVKSKDKKSELHCRFEKSFNINEADECVSIIYTMVNTGKVADTLGPWQITRVPSGGLSFFPTGVTQARGMLLPLLKEANGISWFDYDSAFISKDPDAIPKLFSDGSEGWLAHATNDKFLIIFRFTDTPVEKKSPGEDEIEIFTNPKLNYTELEPLGPYNIIPPGQSYSWTIKWYARQIPKNIKIHSGSTELVKYVRTVIGTSRESDRK